MRLIPGFSVRFGCNLFNASEKIRIEDVRKHYKIGGRFILAVGSVEPRKNYDTIYRAYMMLSETYAHGLPQLLIIGSVSSDSAGIADIIKSDPGAAKYIRIIQPTDSELDVLYKNCEFTILPSLYEGWSLTLPEALSYGKLCVAVDIPPIREAGGAFIRYVPKKDAQNPAVWAEALQWCFDHPNKVLEYEKRIHLDYTALTWRDCAEEINDALAKCNVTERPYQTYFDLTLTWHAAYSNIRITGILRSELMLLRALNKIRKDIKYFAICSRGFFDIDRDTLEILFENMDLGYAFDMSRERIIAQVNKATARRIPVTRYAKAFWMLCSALPSSFQSQLIKLKNRTLISQKYLDPQYSPVPIDEMTEYSIELPDLPFQRGDLIFSSGIEGFPSSYATLINAKKEKGFKFVQLMYDFTPMLTPQTHQKITVSRYIPFAEYVAKISDLVLYGGATAMRDGEKYYREKGFPVPKGVPLKLGADISGSEIAHVVAHDEKILKDLQLDDNFIIIVGTWEYRKNHQALYNAYTRLIEEGLADKIPQLVFCGHPGWKTEHLIHSILNDSRLQGKIMLRTPSDEQLDVLYRNCLFTVLPSLYEGWSLTLPESMRYGKFCIASDVAPLRETGGNFADYVHPYDVAGWADKIYFYANNAFALKAREEKIKNEWHSVTWAECAEEINQHLIMLGETEYEN
jgi:glycosyltransferase involved in cell wall biosynthesis